MSNESAGPGKGQRQNGLKQDPPQVLVDLRAKEVEVGAKDPQEQEVDPERAHEGQEARTHVVQPPLAAQRLLEGPQALHFGFAHHLVGPDDGLALEY